MSSIPRRKTERACPICGTVFMRRLDQKSNICSMGCANKNRTRSVNERFWKWVDKVSSTRGCWLWTGNRDGRGYGRINIGGGIIQLSHRIAWELANGPIDIGLEALHECDTPSCVNPEHLFLGTQAANMHDMKRKGRGRKPRAA